MSANISKPAQNFLVFTVVLVLAASLSIFELAKRSKPLPVEPVKHLQAKTIVTPPPPPPVRKATTNAQVYLRSGKGTNSSILSLLDPGTEVTLGPDSDANWQEVTVGKLHGYVFKQYLKY